MGLNKSNGNMYDFVKTWNPLGGECLHNCSYCSTNTLRRRYKACSEKYSGNPNIDIRQIYKNLGKGNTWFVVGQNDLFARNVPVEIISHILMQCRKFPDNTYFFQTKNPSNLKFYIKELPVNSIICVTLESNREYPEIYNNSPEVLERIVSLLLFPESTRIQITIEPILDFDLLHFSEIIKKISPEQVNIGADSKRNNLPEPNKEKVLELISELEKFTIVHKKSNLERLLK